MGGRVEKIFAKLFFLVFFISCVSAAKTIVVVNSEDWHDAYLASIYAGANGLDVKYVREAIEAQDVVDSLSGMNVNKIVFFTKSTNPLPTLASVLQVINVELDQTTFFDREDLGAELVKRMHSDTVIVVRDDFGFDAFSAKFLSFVLKAPVVFVADGIERIPPKVLDAIVAAAPREIILVGRLKPFVETQLSGLNIKRVSGRDEFENSVLLNKLAYEKSRPGQGVITHGFVLDSTLMNSVQPIIIVPEQGTYYLLNVAEFVKTGGISYLLAIGRGISEAGYFLKERTGARILLKLASVRAGEMREAEVHKDIFTALTGYDLPIPLFAGNVTDFSVGGGSIGSLTGFFAFFNPKITVPIDIKTSFANKGNIEFPVYFVARVFDKDNKTIVALQSEKEFAYPRKELELKTVWKEAEPGTYMVEGTIYGDVQNGIVFQTLRQTFDVTLIAILLPTVLLLLIVFSLAGDAYAAARLRSGLKALQESGRKLEAEFGRTIEKLKE
jgi:putative cell wall-binding protein